MNSVKDAKDPVDTQVFYLGRWVDRDSFRAFVYRDKEQKLAKSYDEYEAYIASGSWFSTPEDAAKKMQSDVPVTGKSATKAPHVRAVVDANQFRKSKHGTNG